MFLLLLFVLGATVGSFLNVCIYRLPRGQSVSHPPSHCPRCDTRLGPLDLVPLLSQVFLRARCRYCGGRIAWRYFGIEALTGVLFVLAGIWAGPFVLDAASGQLSGDWARLAQGLIFMACLVVIFWVDYDTKLIQLEAVFLLGVAGVAGEAWRAYNGATTLTTGGLWSGLDLLPAPMPSSLWAMIVTASFLWAMREFFSRLYGKEALGFGDVMLVAAIGANLGWSPILWTFGFLSVVVGALTGVALQIPRAVRAYRWAKKRARKPSIAPQSTAESVESTDSAATLLLSMEQHEQIWTGRAWPLARHAFRKTIPFGPMLALGAVIALLYGDAINASYLEWIQNASPNATTAALSGTLTADTMSFGLLPATGMP